jgi:hypothetical protein
MFVLTRPHLAAILTWGSQAQKMRWFFFCALAAFYYSLSPGAIAGLGYNRENLNASDQIASNIIEWATLHPATTQVEWPRHGFLELIFEVPFLLTSRILFGGTFEWSDTTLAVQPIVVTALLCTLIFVWVQRITSSLSWAYVLGLTAGVSTMLWPYAYMGLETTQSLFLLLCGYLAIESEAKKSWPRVLMFAFSCAMAIGVKLNGILLVPAVGFLMLCYFRRGSSGNGKLSLAQWRKCFVALLIVTSLFVSNVYIRSLFFADKGGSMQYLRYLVDGPSRCGLHSFSFLCSPNKGLIVFAPVTVLCLAGISKAYLDNQRIVVFALLTLIGLAGGFSLIYIWADETWGPRYLHAAIAPLIICFAVTRKARTFRFGKEIPLLMLAVLGTIISFLGIIIPYTVLHRAATESSRSSLETLQYDTNWNHPLFNLRLLRARLFSDPPDSETWPPDPHWWFEQPVDASASKKVNLRQLAVFQPRAIMNAGAPMEVLARIRWYVYVASFIFGLALFAWIGRTVLKEHCLPPE